MNELMKIKEELLKEQLSLTVEIDSSLKKIRNKAKGIITNFEKRITMIEIDSEKFKENILPDSSAQVKYSQKIYELINETLDKISSPEHINKKSLDDFTKSTRHALEEQDRALVKFIKLLKEKTFRDRKKTLSKSLVRLVKDLKRLEEFILKEYNPNSGLEQLGELLVEILENIDENENRYKLLLEQSDIVKDKIAEIDGVEGELKILQNHEVKAAFNLITEDFSKTQRELDAKFSNIRKAMRTYVNIQSKSKNGKDTSFFKELITDIASTLSRQGSINSVSAVFRELENEMSQGNLRLKKDKRESALKDIKLFLNGDLEADWQSVSSLAKRKETAKQNLDELKLESQIERLEANLLALGRDKNRVFERELRNLSSSTDTLKKLYTEFLGKKRAELKLPDKLTLNPLPQWAINSE